MASPTSRPLLPPILAIECSTKTPKSSLTGLIHHPQREAKELAVVCGLLSKFKAI